jgi:hypothetical protein
MSSIGRSVPAVQLAWHEEPQLRRDPVYVLLVGWCCVIGDPEGYSIEMTDRAGGLRSS